MASRRAIYTVAATMIAAPTQVHASGRSPNISQPSAEAKISREKSNGMTAEASAACMVRTNNTWPMVATSPSNRSQRNVLEFGHVQTKAAGSRDIGVISRPMISTMAFGCSVRDSDFTESCAAAMATADARAIREAPLKVPAPGRMMTSAPKKPTSVAVHRRAPTCSFSSSAAPTVANSGAVKLSAVTAAACSLP
jgi:hypothetical protein